MGTIGAGYGVKVGSAVVVDSVVGDCCCECSGDERGDEECERCEGEHFRVCGWGLEVRYRGWRIPERYSSIYTSIIAV